MTDLDDTVVMDAVNAANGTETPEAFGGVRPANLGQKTDDPSAPYGRRRDGTPRGKPGPKRDGAGPIPSPGGSIPRPTRSGPTKSKRGPQASSRAKTTVDYRPGILGLMQIPAGILGMAGQFNEDLALDGAALSMHAPAVADALNDLADDQPAVAAALDRILSAGPYGAILGALIPLGLQLAANHKLLPDAAVRGGGAVPRDEFRAMLIGASQPGHNA